MKTFIASTLRKFAFYFFEHARIISDFARERRKQKYDELSELEREFQRKRIKLRNGGNTRKLYSFTTSAWKYELESLCSRHFFFLMLQKKHEKSTRMHAWAQNSWRVASPYISSD